MEMNTINVKNSSDQNSNSTYDDCNMIVKEWRNVNGDLDDFIFYYEDKKYLSER